MSKSKFQNKTLFVGLGALTLVTVVGLELKKPLATIKTFEYESTPKNKPDLRQERMPSSQIVDVPEKQPTNAIRSNENIRNKLMTLLESSEMKAEEFDLLKRLKQALGEDKIGQVSFDLILLQIAKRNKIDISSLEAVACSGKNTCEVPVNELFKTSLERLKTNDEFLVQRHLLLDELALSQVVPSEKLSLLKTEFLDPSAFERAPQSTMAENGHASLDNYGHYALINQERLKSLGESDKNVMNLTYQYIMQSKDTPTNLVLAANLFRMYPAQAVEISQALLRSGLSEEDIIYSIRGPD